MKLQDKVAIVTGSNQGIGKAIAQYFAREGAKVVITGRRSQVVQQVAQEIVDGGGTAIGVPVDVTDSSQVNAMVEKVIATFGRIDVLVNNAGGTIGTPICERYVDIDEKDWDRLIDLNLKGHFLCIKAVAPHMIERRSGKIVSISSEAARRIHRGPAGHLPYNSAKAGILGLTRALACDLGPYGITVNAVLPGLTNVSEVTAVWATLPAEVRQQTLNEIPLGRIAEGEEIASVVAFLASDEASYITGASIDVNGGRIMT